MPISPARQAQLDREWRNAMRRAIRRIQVNGTQPARIGMAGRLVFADGDHGFAADLSQLPPRQRIRALHRSFVALVVDSGFLPIEHRRAHLELARTVRQAKPEAF